MNIECQKRSRCQHIKNNYSCYKTLQELITPVSETLAAVRGLKVTTKNMNRPKNVDDYLLLVCPGQVFDPLLKQILVFLEKQKLAKNEVRLVKSLGVEALSQHGSNSGEVSDWLVVHWLSHKITMLLRGGGHIAKITLSETNTCNIIKNFRIFF